MLFGIADALGVEAVTAQQCHACPLKKKTVMLLRIADEGERARTHTHTHERERERERERGEETEGRLTCVV